jgi:hypothetical protein
LDGGPPKYREASVITRRSGAAINSSTGMLVSPSSTRSSSIRSFGFGSYRPGSSCPVRTASRPVSSRPSVSIATAELSSGEASNSSAVAGASTATVCVVPKSTASRRSHCARAASGIADSSTGAKLSIRSYDHGATPAPIHGSI